jgi:hypothetical protein
MRPPRSGAASALTETTPVERQGTSGQRSPRRFYDTPPTVISPASRTKSRRWTRRASLSALAWDILVLAIWIAIVGGLILAMCAALWLVT